LRTAALAAVLLSTWQAWAGAWTRDQGGGYAGMSWSRIAATSVFDGDGGTTPIDRYEQNAWTVYGEVGLVSRWLTATVEAGLLRDNVQDGVHTTGIADWRVGAWCGVLTSPLRVSLGATATLPFGSPTPHTASDGHLPLGSGELALDARVAVGWSWQGGPRWPLRHYFLVEGGYWLREIFADSFVYRAEAGVQLPWQVVDRVWLIGRLLGVESLAKHGSSSPTGLDEGFTVVAPGFEASVRLYRGFAIAAGFETAVRARAVAAGKQVHATASWQW
jgi:hypothetical protein